MERFIQFLERTMQTPGNYGWFHIMFICIVIIGSVAAVILAKKASPKAMRIFLIVCASVMLCFEIYKQIVFTFTVVDGKIVADYQWYAFPFQLCSTPMYILLIAGLVKPGKFQDWLCSYLAFFSLFGGLCVYLYPNDVFTSCIGINIQTMFHHGLQIVTSCFIISYYGKKIDWNFLWHSFPVFGVQLVVAMGLNLLAPVITTETINMFYISPYHDCTLPVLSMIYPKVPYVVFFLIYVLGFCLVATIIFGAIKGIQALASLIARKRNKKYEPAE